MAPRHKNPSRRERTAVAPYNFIPLGDIVVPAEIPPDRDRYVGLSGHFLVRLTTQSPTYIRGLLTTSEYRYQEEGKDIEGKDTTKLADGRKVRLDIPFRKIAKNKPEFFNYGDENQPIIPGSSLRGMLRTLFEIVTYSKLQPVSDALKIYFRAVAAEKKDPLEGPYEDVIGNNAKNVHVGYLEYDDTGWYVRPAKTPRQVDGRLSRDRYLKIRKDAIGNGSVKILISDYLGLDHKDYKPQYYPVTFDIGRIWYINKKKKEKKEPISANKIGSVNDKLPYNGALVATGNMLETSDGSQASPRMNVYLVPEASDKKRIKLSDRAVEDYLSALTPFQKDVPFSSSEGVLQEGRPIFYIPPKGKEDVIIYFGHTPNFRIPHLIGNNAKKRAVTPQDFVPEHLRTEEVIDFAEAVFGFIRSSEYRQKKGLKQGDKRAGYLSRVFVTDAGLTGKQSNIFFVQEGDNTIVPKIMATPKPTAFQLYLAQPDSEKNKVKYYGSQPDKETVVRGYKLYWHKGRVLKEDLEPKVNDPGIENGAVKETSTQHTQMKPLRPDLTFEFRVYFENLTEVELGALCWILSLPENHCHKIGMGKPLGMGAILLHDIELHVNDSLQRYQMLLVESAWSQPALRNAKTIDGYKGIFEKNMLSQLANEVDDFHSLPRIQMLLLMLRWWQRDENWLSATRYLEIRHGAEQTDEYSERTVLPNPDGVIESNRPELSALYIPSQQRFQPKEGKQLTGKVEYFRKSGGITPDGGGEKVHIHRRNLPAGLDTLKVGQRVRFIAVREGDMLEAYEIELINE